MKIDLEMLERMVATGATGAMVLAMVRLESEREETRLAARRPKEKARKQRTRAGQKRTEADRHGTATETERLEATVSDTPRARLFREGKGALLTMRISENRAGGLIAQWLKLTGDDEQLVLAAILQAQKLGAADAPGYIMEVLKGKTNGDGTGPNRANSASGQSGSAAILAGVAEATERRARERAGPSAQRPAGSVPSPDVARGTDLELFGARDG